MLEVLRLATDNYKEVAVLDGEEPHYDSHRDSATEEQIEREEDKGDSNVADIDDEVDDEHDCEVVDYNDSQEQSADTGLHVGLAEQQVPHVLRWLRRDTFLLEDVYVSSEDQRQVEQGHQTGVGNGHNMK